MKPCQAHPIREETAMQLKTLRQREKELQALLATPAGRHELEELAARYAASGGQVRPERVSAITQILVYERVRGLIGS
jgi:hypothetical protein